MIMNETACTCRGDDPVTAQYSTPESMRSMISEFTSTGSKVPWHRDIIDGLHEGRGVPKVTGIFVGDACQHKSSQGPRPRSAQDRAQER